MYPRIVSRCINWVKSHGSCGVEFEEQCEEVRVFVCTWDRDVFWRVCMATLDRYRGNPHQQLSTLGRLIDALGSDVSVVSSSGGRTILVEAFCEYLGSGYRQKLNDYSVLIFAWSKVVCSGQLPACSVVWTELQWIHELQWVHFKAAERRWDIRLDVILPRSEESHVDERFGYASSCGHCCQHHRCVANDCLLFERDGTQRWRR